ncbi:hypothetical protein [Paenibacillus pabuli]|uniref:hypothetical protein n=1 Tax=Paenibacillus pabuli TaxID=1472 RepID=UPI003CEC6581
MNDINISPRPSLFQDIISIDVIGLTYNSGKANKPLLYAEVSIDNNYHYHVSLIVRPSFFPVNAFYIIQKKAALLPGLR